MSVPERHARLSGHSYFAGDMGNIYLINQTPVLKLL